MKDKPLSPELDSIELHPDAWERTAAAVKAVAAHRPMPHQDKAKPSVVGKRKS